ncbi:DNA-binding response OmpR family regulator [Alkalibaculum bacchi]|uniref:Stage 0 sporulation protein A homolog n=1 Tax=Alkalibaculum bacchi TaxID=645887 RepID=A0A366I993_9FIRM|nr:response regulator transcription factor [Alkalibaculum bacchi]RBP66030.1 DNA-binding response OmpR family regulator [Alkalibaculum bacchi]
MKQILLVEDDVMIASGLVYALENEGYAPTHCKDIDTAFSEIITNKFDLAILDMQLPDGTGFDISQKLKNTGTAIIFLTIVDDENKIVRAFDDGAADYITKPFRLRELLARVKRTLKASGGADKPELLFVGNVNIDTTAGKVFVGTRQVDLTALEYRLLLIFASNKSRLLTRTQILENIWDYGEHFVEDNTLTVYVKRLREKLGDAVKIETVRGIGYRVD